MEFMETRSELVSLDERASTRGIRDTAYSRLSMVIPPPYIFRFQGSQHQTHFTCFQGR